MRSHWRSEEVLPLFLLGFSFLGLYFQFVLCLFSLDQSLYFIFLCLLSWKIDVITLFLLGFSLLDLYLQFVLCLFSLDQFPYFFSLCLLSQKIDEVRKSNKLIVVFTVWCLAVFFLSRSVSVLKLAKSRVLVWGKIWPSHLLKLTDYNPSQGQHRGTRSTTKLLLTQVLYHQTTNPVGN